MDISGKTYMTFGCFDGGITSSIPSKTNSTGKSSCDMKVKCGEKAPNVLPLEPRPNSGLVLTNNLSEGDWLLAKKVGQQPAINFERVNNSSAFSPDLVPPTPSRFASLRTVPP